MLPGDRGVVIQVGSAVACELNDREKVSLIAMIRVEGEIHAALSQAEAVHNQRRTADAIRF